MPCSPVISAQFASALDDRVAGTAVGTEAQAAIDDAKAQPLSGGDVSDVPNAEAAALDDDIVSASESAFGVGMLIGAALMVLGGLISLLGVRNPERPTEPERAHLPGAAAAAGECGRTGERPAPSPVPGTLAREPAGAGAPDAAL